MPARTVFIGCQSLIVQIILYGVLGARFGREHRLAVHSCAEAIHALCVSIPGFKRFLHLSEERGLTFAVFRGKQNLSVDEMDMRSGRAEPIRIAPIVMGRKAGLFQTIAATKWVIALHLTTHLHCTCPLICIRLYQSFASNLTSTLGGPDWQKSTHTGRS